jgi:hypothetical protein
MNMRKEYRRELKQIVAARKKLLWDLNNFERGIIAACRQMDKRRKELGVERERAIRRTAKELQRLDRRKFILEGRLS